MKTLTWQRIDGKWLIVGEVAEPLPKEAKAAAPAQ